MDMNEMQKKFAGMDKLAREFTSHEFERVWRKLSHNHGKDMSLVKQNFVRNMIEPVNRAFNRHLIENGMTDLAFNNDFIMSKASIEAEIEAIFYYHLFYTRRLSEYDRAKLTKDEKYKQKLAYEVGMTIVSRINDIKHKSETSELSPEIVACREICDAILYIVASKSKKDVKSVAGVLEIYASIASTAKSILALLSKGMNREAFVLWRNLHEQECIIRIMTRFGDDAILPYMNHSFFADAENLQVQSEIDRIMSNIKEDFKKGVGRRDFINYGWLINVPEFDKGYDEGKYKFSFTNGLQQFAYDMSYFSSEEQRGKTLKRSRDFYSYASKFTHPTFHATRLAKEDAFRPCIVCLYLSIAPIAFLFGKLAEANKFFPDEKFESYYEQMIVRLEEVNKILHENLGVKTEGDTN